MIKAYECIYEEWDANYVNVYWAETPGKAKSQALHDDELGDPDCFTDIYVRRAPWADELEHASEYTFLLESLRQGWIYDWYDDELRKDRYLDEEAVPVLEQVGSLENYWKLYDEGKIKIDSKGIPTFVK